MCALTTASTGNQGIMITRLSAHVKILFNMYLLLMVRLGHCSDNLAITCVETWPNFISILMKKTKV